MSSLIPATRYTVKVFASRDLSKSTATTTEFTTGSSPVPHSSGCCEAATPATVVSADVDTPVNLAASNVQTESATLTWKAPRAGITGYILSFEAVDGAVRVSRQV